MNQTLEPETCVTSAEMGYLGWHPSQPEIFLCKPPPGVPPENSATDLRTVEVNGVRGEGLSPQLEAEGFTYLRDELPDIDFSSADQVVSEYYPILQRLALLATGGQRAYVFDHLLRQRSADMSLHKFGERGAQAVVGALGRVHNDYSEGSGRLRLELVMDRFGIKEIPRRYCIVNLWRSVGGLIEDAPLAFCSAESVSTTDLIATKLHYGSRTGEIYLVKFSPSHRWWYLEDMDVEDVAVFKQFDSKVSGTSRMVPHSAFELPGAEAAKSPRRSIEARVLVVFD